MRSVRSWCMSVVAIGVLAACSETPVELPKATTINVAPGALTMTITDVVQVTAQVVDQTGAMMPTAVPLWSSDKPGIATVVNAGSGAGTVTAMSAGTATLTATYGGVTSVVEVTVDAPTVKIAPRSVQLYAGFTQTVFAKVTGGAGQDLGGAVTVTWQVANPAIATLSASSGQTPTITARTTGTTSIIATAAGKADTIPVVVVIDSRSLVSNLNILPDSVTFDAAQALPLEFEYRVNNANGGELCVTAAPVLGFRANSAFITTVQTSANVGGIPTCRIRLSVVTGTPGGSWLYASVNNVTDSVFVNINAIAYTAAFTKLPVTAPVTTTRAGDTVTYDVTVLNEASLPAAGVNVGFNVTGGTLSARNVVTNAQGVATVSWYLPQRTTTGLVLPPGGSAHTINFRLEFPSGATSALTASVPVIVPGPTARVVLLANTSAAIAGPTPAVDTLVPTSGSTCTAATCELGPTLGLTPATANLGLFVQSFDRFNNPRVTNASFTATDPGARVGVVQQATAGNSAQTSTTLQTDRIRTDTITATDGGVSAAVTVKWGANPYIVFQQLASNAIWTGQPTIFTVATGIPGDTNVYTGGAGAAAYPTKTMRADTLAFAWTNGGLIDVGLVASNGSNSGAPVSAIPASHRATAVWGFPGFESAVSVTGTNHAGGVVFLSDRDAAKNANTGLADLAATATGYTRAVGSFITDGFVVGQKVIASGFGTVANNGVSTVTDVQAGTLTVTKSPVTAVEAAPGANTRQIRASNTAGANNPSYWDLYIRDRSNGNIVRVTSTSADSTQIMYRGLSISPDGKKALLVSDAFAGGGGIPARVSQVYEVDLASGARTALTGNTNIAVIYRHAQYSQDGTKIYIDANDNGTREIIERTAAGTYNVLKTGGQTGTGLDVGASFYPNAQVLGYINTNILQIFTLPSGTNAQGRRNLQWFTWVIR
jgi:hypothetical protein